MTSTAAEVTSQHDGEGKDQAQTEQQPNLWISQVAVWAHRLLNSHVQESRAVDGIMSEDIHLAAEPPDEF